MVLNAETLNVLHRSCPLLKAFHLVSVPWEWDEKLRNNRKRKGPKVAQAFWKLPIDLYAGPGLEELTLESCYDLPWWRTKIVEVLKDSPNLKKLRLSLLEDTIVHFCNNAHDSSPYEDWFDILCREYGRTGAPPLRLQSLHCGLGVFPQETDAITQLMNLSCLEEVYVDNKSVQSQYGPIILYEDGVSSGIPFRDFLGSNLRQLSVYSYRRDVHSTLSQIADP